MISGGNSALKEFTDYYEISDFPIEIKYKTKALFLYRRMLTDITLGKNFEEEFCSVDEGKKVIEREDGNFWFKDILSTTKSIGSQALGHLDTISKKTGIANATEKIIKEISSSIIKDKTSAILGSLASEVKSNYNTISTKTLKLKKNTIDFYHNLEDSIQNGLSRSKPHNEK